MAGFSPELRADIAAIPMFEGLPDRHLENLTRIATQRSYDRNEMFFLEGTPGDGFYVAIDGRAKVFKTSSDGKEQILHVFGPHEPFGEVPVFEGGQYPASASALEKCRALFFPRDAFIGLLEQDPSLALNILAILSKRLRRFTEFIEALSLKEVPGRLAAHLLHLHDKQGSDHITLDVPKGQLANLLGTIPETLSRILGKMTQQDLLRSTGPRAIELVDVEGLRDLAEGRRRLS